MPEISRFFGIRIALFLNDHNPPHFHVLYEGHRAVFDMQSLQMTAGSLSARVRGFVVEWAALHQAELLDAWETVRSGNTPNRIAPLE